MPVTLDVLQNHLAYTAWASARLLDATAKLTAEERARNFGTADRSVDGTLAHIFGADRVWLTRVSGAPSADYPTPEEQNLAFLQDAWPNLHERWIAWARTLNAASPSEEITYRDLKGNEWRQPLWQIILHVVNHATHHRGQVAGFIRSLGHTPPSIDLAFFDRKQS
jgi:uncharacterized damage-inducible protein DinB